MPPSELHWPGAAAGTCAETNLMYTASQPAMTLILALPVFNEEAQLADSVIKLSSFLARQSSWGCEVVIADNASTDRTWEIGRELEKTLGKMSVLTIDTHHELSCL